jgi:ABC-type transport system substrate-binding protein
VPAKTTSTTPTTTTTTASQYGGTLKILTALQMTNVGEPGKNLNLADRIYSLPACEFLTVKDNADAKVTPHLATAWQASTDNTSITFTLRKGVKFHDGTDFNATAVKFNLDRALTGKIASLNNVSSVEMVDDYTIKINLKKFDIKDILSGYVQIGMASPTALQKLGNDALFHAVGTGPYQFVSYKQAVSLTYERFNNYWKGKPYLDNLAFDFIADETTQLMAFRAGVGDAVIRISERPTSILKPLGFKINTSPTAAWGIIYNSKDPKSPFSDIKVRQAVSYAINAQAIAKALSYGEPSYVNQFAARPEVPGTTYNPAIVGYPYNPEKAKQLLKEAGYPSGFNTALFTLNEQWFLDMCQASVICLMSA